MTPQIRFQRHQLADLQAIRDLGAGALRKAIEALRKLPVVPTRTAKIQATLEEALKETGKNGEPLLRQVLSLHGMVRQLDLTPDVVFSGLNAGLQPNESDWTKEEFDQWLAVSPLIRELFELEIILLTSKALDLSFEHSELLQRARILTDIRPVFNSDASEVKGTVISHSLLLRYDDIEGNHMLSLALDEDDIQSLMRQCERALKKSKIAKTHLEGKANIPTLIPGTKTDE